MFSPLAFQAATRAFQISSRSMCRMVPERAWSRRDGAHAADTKSLRFCPDDAIVNLPRSGGHLVYAAGASASASRSYSAGLT